MYRIVDANINRLREGIRVIEDIVRFLKDDATCFRALKTIRHDIQRITEGIENALINARASESDVGSATVTASETLREDVDKILRANFIRAEEAARVLEEVLKTITPEKSEIAKSIRFRLYTLEKDVRSMFATTTDGGNGKKHRTTDKGVIKKVGRHIGINAYYFDEPYLGFGRYTRNLVSALLERDHRNRYTLFTPKPLSLDGVKFNPRKVKVVQLGEALHENDRRAWDMGFVNEDAFRTADVDVLFIPYNTPPQAKEKTYALITTLHDVIPALIRDIRHLWRNRHVLGSFSYPSYRNFMEDIRYAKEHADRVITVSEYSKHEMTRLFGIEGDRVDVVYNSLEERYFVKDADPPKVEDAPYFLYVGGNGKRKNLMTVLRAYKRLPSAIRDEHRLVVVAKVAKNREGAYIAKHLSNHVTVYDYVNEDDLFSLYTHARLFLFPSYYEGFGLPPVEAMARGTLAVTSRRSSLGEVTAGQAVYCIPESAGLVAASIMKALSLTEGECEKRLFLAKTFFREHFDAKKNADRLLEILLSV